MQQIIQGPLVQHQIIQAPGARPPVIAQPGSNIINQPTQVIAQPGAVVNQPGGTILTAPGGQILQPGSIVMGPNGSIKIINQQNTQTNLSAGQVGKHSFRHLRYEQFTVSNL